MAVRILPQDYLKEEIPRTVEITQSPPPETNIIPFQTEIQNNKDLIIFGIVAISITGMVIAYLYSKN